MEKSHSP